MAWHRSADQWLRDHPGHVDAALAGVLWFFCAGGSLTFGVAMSVPDAILYFVISSLETLPLAWRRTKTTLSAGVVVLACLLHLALVPLYLPSIVAVPIIVFTLAKYGRRWESTTGLALSLLGAILSTVTFGAVGGLLNPAYLVFNALVIMLGMLVVWTSGDLARTRRLNVQTLEERAQRLEKEQAAERAAAAADERARIARDMHDVVAHSLSVMVAQADGGRYAAAQSPDTARQALETIAATGRESLREMRRLLGILRNDDDAEYRPQPTIASLPELVETVAAAGQPVELHAHGSRTTPLPQGAELVVYRAVQEALTNVLKHAGPAAAARVDVRWAPDGIHVSVTDNGRGSQSDRSGEGSRLGLAGMRERVSLYGGTVSAAPLPRGGFAVSLFIPVSEDA
ncbi:sensor histidine kinase [Zhihengliuella salsuginis]|uniref:histidine kinase n=1 Tax=Zhihengliuella salsuginis TaxID=578222 RepID=A0ABQ3GJS1_9MICC|nr:histidine kinase [Zhihengliuella salsuginis]GHD08235.1 two-component sensor histidine kinase [Zhihengliuella salsuginis]